MLADRSYRPVGMEPDLSISAVSPEYDQTQTVAAADTNLRRLPRWVAYDRKVCRFYGYFKEAVFSSRIENFRVRKCEIYYYLEDESIHIVEPKIENSGIPQGVFIKRHRIPMKDGRFISLDDISIGVDLEIYGRVFRIVDADDFTRSFFSENGAELAEPEDFPADPFTQKTQQEHGRTNFNKKMYSMKEHMEASLGKMMGCNIQATQKFLANDRKVLRFFCMWADDKMFGERLPYVLHYFLADDTVEVLELSTPNSGRDSFPSLLNRTKLPKNFEQVGPNLSRIGWQGDESVQYYSQDDFKIGSEVNVYGRKLFLCGCDAFTKNYYIENYGLKDADFPFLLVDEEQPVQSSLTAPQHNGYGSEQDSLGSFLFLIPKLPKVDYKKLMENDGKKLTFLARFVDAKPEDASRRFIVNFYMANDQVSIFERFQRNSGFIGGNFLQKQQVHNEETGLDFAPTDFKVGKILTINKFKFELLEANEWTSNFMNANPSMFS
jgi:hypothetical protein